MNSEKKGCDSSYDNYHFGLLGPFVVCLLSKSKASGEREISSVN